VSQDAAQQAALRAMPGSAIRETVLADFSDTHHVPAIHALAWVISLADASGFRPHPAGPARGGRGGATVISRRVHRCWNR